MKHELSLDALKHLDMGKVYAAWNADLARLIQDCRDRPGDDRPRTHVLAMRMVPELDQGGDCTDAQVDFVVKASVPARRSRVYRMGVTRRDSAFFIEESPDEPDQTTMFDKQVEGGAE